MKKEVSVVEGGNHSRSWISQKILKAGRWVRGANNLRPGNVKSINVNNETRSLVSFDDRGVVHCTLDKVSSFWLLSELTGWGYHRHIRRFLFSTRGEGLKEFNMRCWERGVVDQHDTVLYQLQESFEWEKTGR